LIRHEFVFKRDVEEVALPTRLAIRMEIVTGCGVSILSDLWTKASRVVNGEG
jgi:hypothetical protein